MTDPAVDRAPVEYATDRMVWRSVLQGAAVGLVVGIALAAIGHFVGLTQPSLFLIASSIAVVVIIQLVRVGVVDAPPPVPASPTELVVSEYFVKLRHLERRLETSTRGSDDFEWTIRPILADIINGRLLNEHGINYRTDPVRARTIVGEQLWEIMIPSADRPERSMSQGDLTTLVTQLEQL